MGVSPAGLDGERIISIKALSTKLVKYEVDGDGFLGGVTERVNIPNG